MRQRSIIILFTAVLTVVWSVIPAITHYIATQAILTAQKSGLRFQVRDLVGQRIGLSASSIEGWAAVNTGHSKSYPISFSYKIEEVLAKVRLSFFPPALPRATVTASAYKGKIDLVISSILGSPTANFSIQALDLSEHPQLMALGVTSGVINARIAGQPAGFKWTKEASYALEISNLGFDLPPIFRDVTKISSISDGNLSARALVQPKGDFELTSCSINSSIGTGTITARGQISSSGNISSITGTLRVKLDRPDSEKLMAWIPLITDQRVSSSQNNFGCAFESTQCGEKPRFGFQLGSACVRVVCNP